MNVTPWGYRSGRDSSESDWQRRDLFVLAHIQEEFRLPLDRYVHSRMAEVVKEPGVDVSQRQFYSLFGCPAILRRGGAKVPEVQ